MIKYLTITYQSYLNLTRTVLEKHFSTPITCNLKLLTQPPCNWMMVEPSRTPAHAVSRAAATKTDKLRLQHTEAVLQCEV